MYFDHSMKTINPSL